MYVSEHRKSYDNKAEFCDISFDNPDIVLFPFSVTRFEAEKASEELLNENVKASVFHQLWIKPLKVSDQAIEQLKNSKYGGIVLDDDYPNGIAKQIAYELMLKTGKKVEVLTIEEKSAGFQPYNDNLPPSKDKICNLIKKIISKN
jgi:deoxyxylulose-5-phosphate synthase